MFNRNYIENPSLLEENRLPPRSMLLPAGRRGVRHENFTDSDRIKLLNGNWRFSYLPADTRDAFWEPSLDDGGWDLLEVPSMWQYKGYGTCLYPNVQYCFPYDPPYIDRDNPVGLYRYRFTAAPSGRRAVLRFMGVDNAFFVWLNGEYVGFSKGSRLAAEFDVTDKLRDGENLIAVKVYTYSDASYLENQDMLMASGIFRDVMLVYTGANSLWDYTIKPEADGFRLFCECTTGDVPAELCFRLYDADGAEVSDATVPLEGNVEAFLPVDAPILWNAEQPYLYELVTTVCEDGRPVEVHTKRAGLYTTESSGGRLLHNGRPIRLKGVNRHENNPWTGRTLSTAQIRRELEEIKACGLNAIRCSHYTNQPVFYEVASELGIYVMDEADCETHGASATGDQGALNKDKAWRDAFFDRASRMYYQNKNETCINIWSLGNECGTGSNAAYSAAWLREQRIQKPIKFSVDPEVANTFADFRTTGYMPMSVLHESAEEGAPLMLVEYGHAMGNSPGGLEDIWNWIYTHDHCCGGYVWEFKGHGFYAEGRDGRARYLYGGDFSGDIYHWSNFTLDGYFTSDGTPKPAWDELREVSAPVRIEAAEGGVIVHSTYDFKTLDGIVMRWSVRCDGETVRGGEISLGAVPARGSKFCPLDMDVSAFDGLCTLDLEFFEGERKLSHKQLKLAEPTLRDFVPTAFVHTVEGDEDCLIVRGEDFALTITDGLPSRLEKNGCTLIDAPMKLNMWRAPTDNDGIENLFPRRMGEWRSALVHSMRFGCHSVTCADAPDCVTVTATGRFLPEGRWWGFDTTLTYRIYAGGIVNAAVDMKPYGKLPAVLPRVGVMFELPENNDRADWFGRGPGDSYSDRKACALIGLWEGKIASLNFRYDVPQETGSHEDCRFVRISGGTMPLGIVGRFAFSCHDFTLENLTKARHADELAVTEKKYLYIDHRQRGLGSHSCGPEPEAEYELTPGEFSYDFTIVPGMGSEAMELTHYKFS